MTAKINNRQKVELLVYEALTNILKEQGYVYIDSGTRREIRYIHNNVSWRFHIALHDPRPPYGVLEGVGVIHEDLSFVINNLLKERYPEKYWLCGPGTHLVNYWNKEGNGQRINGVSDIDRFVLEYIQALNKAKSEFLIPYSNQEKLINECSLFYTKWPKAMGPFDTALCLIAYGIKHDDRQKIQLGVDRIYQKREWGQTADVREIPLFVRQRVIDMGLAAEST